MHYNFISIVIAIFLVFSKSTYGFKTAPRMERSLGGGNSRLISSRQGARGSQTSLGMSKEIVVVRGPTEKQINTCRTWPVWGCGASKFPWSYSDRETALMIKGKCTVTPDDMEKFGPAVSIESGDLVTFPAGMSCVWDVTEEISKHYNFG